MNTPEEGQKMSVRIERVERYDEAVYAELMERNLGPSVSTTAIRRMRCESFEKRAESIRLGAFDEERLIGLSWGAAKSPSCFVMHVSLVEEEYRGQGIYTAMLDMMLSATRDYDEVESHHHMLNNEIMAIKLRRGFHIVGFDQSILIGPRVTLRYFHNEALLSLMRQRAGLPE